MGYIDKGSGLWSSRGPCRRRRDGGHSARADKRPSERTEPDAAVPSTWTRILVMRQLKHHEKKLLKKVDFLNVRNKYSLVSSQPLMEKNLVEAGLKLARDQDSAPVSYPAARRLPQVQQTRRQPQVLCPQADLAPGR